MLPRALKLALYILIPLILAWQSEMFRSCSQQLFTRIAESTTRRLATSSLQQGNMTSTARTSRIRIQKPEDFGSLYSMILYYAQNPERAAFVTEFVFRCEIRQEMYLRMTNRPDEWKAREIQRSIAGEKDIQNAIKVLNLEEDQRRHWVKVLTWMRPDYLAERKAALQEDVRAFEIEPYFRNRDAVFANHAAALLLMLCPNIERLTYEDNIGNPVFETLRRNNYGLLGQTYLQKLTHVRILPTSAMIIGDERFYVSMNFHGLLRMFHRLPSIESVSVDAISPDDRGDYEPNFPPGSGNFTKLSVGHSQMPSHMIAALIGAPKRLEEFTFTTGGRASNDGGFYQVYPKTIGKALGCHKDTLRIIDLDLDEHLSFSDPLHGQAEDDLLDEDDPEAMERPWGFWDKDLEETQMPLHTSELRDTRDYGSTIGSMHDLISVAHLSIGIQLLLGPRPRMKMFGRALDEIPFRLVDALPQSLESLLIRGYTKGEDEHFDSQIEELIALRWERLPNLRSVEGIESCIPSAKSVERPDENYDQLWQLPEAESEYV